MPINPKAHLLSEKPGFFKKLLEETEMGIITTDRDGYIVFLNQQYADFLGVSRSEAQGVSITKFVPNSRMPVVGETGISEINQIHEFENQHTSTIVHRIPIREDGVVVAVFGIILFKSTDTMDGVMEKMSLLNSKVKYYENELKTLKSITYTFANIVGESPLLLQIKKEAQKAAKNQFPVFITGESGTGKELLAQAIHYASPRKTSPFVRVNCAAIPSELFESELFGYEKGAFTGASNKGKIGKFELANGGTIFLDEIGDLPIELQPKLLRVLELKEFERVGGNKVIRSNFRIISATNRDLTDMMKEGTFRQDLYYRLNVIPLHSPPLRERQSDIPLLIAHYIKKSVELLYRGVDNISVSEAAMRCLKQYQWPGNARELLNVTERMLSTLEGTEIKLVDLPPYIQNKSIVEPVFNPHHASLSDYMAEVEKNAILDVLKSVEGNKSKAAKRLGIHRTLLYRKMRILGIPTTE